MRFRFLGDHSAQLALHGVKPQDDPTFLDPWVADVSPGQVIECPYELPADRFDQTSDPVTPLDEVVTVLGPPETLPPSSPEAVELDTAAASPFISQPEEDDLSGTS